jgi:hypothetical protein
MDWSFGQEEKRFTAETQRTQRKGRQRREGMPGRVKSSEEKGSRAADRSFGRCERLCKLFGLVNVKLSFTAGA